MFSFSNYEALKADGIKDLRENLLAKILSREETFHDSAAYMNVRLTPTTFNK